MSWETSRWASLGSNPKNNRDKKDHLGQKQLLINSSDNDTDDEEWIQQLERDYGKRQQKKTKLSSVEKILSALLFSALVIIALLVSSLLYSRYRHGETLLEFTLGGQNLCNKDACVEASHRINTYINKDGNPCHDFYNYACGSWLQKTEIPSPFTKWTTFTDVSERNKIRLKKLLDNLKLGDENSKALQKVRQFYKSCQRKNFIEKSGNQSLIKLIDFVGSWAFTNKSTFNEEQWNFGQALTRIHHLKSMPLFYMYVAADDKNSSHNIIQIEQSGITLNDESIYKRNEKDKVLASYKKLLVTVPLLLGGRKEDIVSQANEIFDFEKKLSLIFENKGSIRSTDQLYNKMTVAQLQSLAPAIPWLDYMNSMFSEPVKATEDVVVYTPKYLKSMSDLVIKTDRRIIANYMVWHLIKPILTLLSKPYRLAALELSNEESGVKSVDDSWKNCVSKTDSVFGFATGHLFVRQMEKEGNFNKKQVGQLLEKICEEFKLNLRNVKWMDDVTKKRAADKAASIINIVGYPEWIQDITKLDKYYEELQIPEDPLQSLFNAKRFYHEKTMQRRGKPVERNQWHITPTEVNAYYNAPNNNIALPSGILQSPFFDLHYPMAINYGSLGTMMAHELIHGFDAQGRHFDKTGNFVNWWTNSTTSKYFNQSKCFENQYNDFIRKMNITSPAANLPENLADNGGLKIAYNAFKANEYIHGADKRLPASTFTTDQLFYIGFAQTWCSLTSSDTKDISSIMQSHSAEKNRVNLALSNSKEFSKAFQCPANTNMNPSKKCSFW